MTMRSMMISSISKFCKKGREKHTIASKLEGTLLISTSYFPYFMLVAFEAGGPLRALLLLFIYPLLWFLESVSLKKFSLRIIIFITLVGLKVSDVKAVAKAVLPRFLLEDVRENVYRVFSSCGGKKYVLSSIPRIMVEPFLHEYLNVDCVIGTELKTANGFCLGLVAEPGFKIGVSEYRSLRTALGEGNWIDVGIGNSLKIDNLFLFLCQIKRYVFWSRRDGILYSGSETQLLMLWYWYTPRTNSSKDGYIVQADDKPPQCLGRNDYPKPLIFHDGRLVARPTPLDSLSVFLWLPVGVVLAISRLLIGKFFPYNLSLMAAAATGMKIRANLPSTHQACRMHIPHSRTLYVCSHRTLIDPVIVATALQRPVTAVTYSVSRISEVLSPIRTVRLSRDRVKDGETMRELLRKGELVVCPEGTTCREPYLLRFSPLFAEIAEVIVPVATSARASMFYGTTVRGYKWLDSLFFLMNPNPEYYLEFLEKVPGVGLWEKSSYEMANHVQGMIGQALGYQCTNLTRRDKYRMLAGNDGLHSK